MFKEASLKTHFFLLHRVLDNPTAGVAIDMLPLVRTVSYGVSLSLYRQVLSLFLSPLSQLACCSFQFFHMIIREKGKRGEEPMLRRQSSWKSSYQGNVLKFSKLRYERE
jgi:hypothetical protein